MIDITGSDNCDVESTVVLVAEFENFLGAAVGNAIAVSKGGIGQWSTLE